MDSESALLTFLYSIKESTMCLDQPIRSQELCTVIARLSRENRVPYKNVVVRVETMEILLFPNNYGARSSKHYCFGPRNKEEDLHKMQT